jgi:hypothetical protein
MIENHLTGEEMDALLMEPELRDRSQHLVDCDLCLTEFESLQRVMGELRTAVIASAEQHYRAAALPAISQQRPRLMWGLAAAAAFICVVGSITLHQRPVPVAVVNAPQQQVQGGVSDEQMLSNVQEDLSASVPQPMLPLAATDATDSTYASTDGAKENE